MKVVERICKQCGKKYEKGKHLRLVQWATQKYCSRQCAGIAKRIDDGMNKSERWCRKKKGMKKQHTDEWLKRIKATTKAAMYRPDVQEKIRQPKGPMTERGRMIRSDALAGIMPKNMLSGGSYPNIQSGDYENSHGTMYFRSKWEANYALFLDFLIKQGEINKWEYEVDTFVFDEIKFGSRSYRPDFKVFNLDDTFEYHEVKGYMDRKSKTKLKRMAKYFPQVKIVLIDSKFYADLKKKMGKILNFY